MLPSKPVKRLLLRLPAQVHRRLLDLAESQSVSVNTLCTRLISAGLEARGASPFEELAKLLEKEWVDNLLGIVLFGSAARGELRPNSDIDLLIVLDRKLPLTRELYRRWDDSFDAKARQIFLREVNPHFVHLPDKPELAGGIWLENSLEGRIIFDPSGVIEKCLQSLRAYIAGGGKERAQVHGHPYWITMGVKNAS